MLKTSEAFTLKSELTEQVSKFERDLKRTESEKEVILDDLDGLHEQYQQLQEAYDSQSRVMGEVHAEVERLTVELVEKEAQLAALHSRQRERRESLSRVSVGFQCTPCQSKYLNPCLNLFSGNS